MIKYLAIITLTISLYADCEYCDNLEMDSSVEVVVNGRIKRNMIDYIIGNCDVKRIRKIRSDYTIVSNFGKRNVRAQLSPKLEQEICIALHARSRDFKRLQPEERHLLIHTLFIEFIATIPNNHPRVKTTIVISDRMMPTIVR